MRRRAKQTPASLSLSQILSRVVIVAAVVGFFFLLVLLINHWYLHSLTKTLNAPQGNASTPSEAGLPAAPIENPSDKEVNLTFYETLNQASSPNTPAMLPPPENQNPSPSAAASPQPPTPAAAAPSTTPSVSYTVQVGSFRSREGADAIVNALAAQGFVSAITPVTTTHGETWYRVRVGNFSRREEADKAAQHLRQKGDFQPFVMSQALPPTP